MSKRFLQAGIALALMGGSGAAMADITSPDLEVKGRIRTPSCSVTSGENREYQYEKIDMNQIPASGYLQLARLPHIWTVQCEGEAKTLLGFTVVDNRAESLKAKGNNNFSLGAVEGFEGSNIGYFTVELSQAYVDNQVAYALKADSMSASGTGAAITLLDKTQAHSWAAAAGANRAPMPGNRFDMLMTVQGYIANKTAIGADITAGIPLDGHLTLNYSFGL